MKVVIPSQLRGYTGGAKEVEAAGATLAEALADLDRQFPGFRFRVIDEQDRVRQHILIFVGGERCEDVRDKIPEGAEVFIAGALSGG
ncbi:MAG: MoaD/ThiS family protein [Deltaproteobacteria bacterium]|nr:MoaD/ThiS family protein [Deltaproteobacteria bacterium]